MKRIAIVLALAVVLTTAAGCASSQKTAAPGTGAAATSASPSASTTEAPSVLVGKTRVFEHVVKVYDPAKYPKAAMDGEPSRISFFKPTHDEGVVNRDYPSYDSKTFKFLALPGAAMVFPPQGYYMFVKNGGTVNAALKSSGYKAVEIRDSGHIKIFPNLYTGYYDFAWFSMSGISEYWSGYESMNRELWRGGNDYVIVANSFNGGIALMAPPEITGLKDLAGKKVGIMNAAFSTEAYLNKKLGTVGLATESAGGNVGIEMGTPGFVMNELMAKKLSAVFAWGSYEGQLKKLGFRELVPWKELGYGDKLPCELLMVRRDILAKHPDIVQKVVQANYDATQQALKVGDYKKSEYASAEHYWSYYMGIPKKISDMPLDKLMNIDDALNPSYLHDIYDYMTKYGYFKIPYRFDELVNTTFQDKVKR